MPSSAEQSSLVANEPWQLIWSSSAASMEQPIWNPQDNIELGACLGLTKACLLGWQSGIAVGCGIMACQC